MFKNPLEKKPSEPRHIQGVRTMAEKLAETSSSLTEARNAKGEMIRIGNYVVAVVNGAPSLYIVEQIHEDGKSCAIVEVIGVNQVADVAVDPYRIDDLQRLRTSIEPLSVGSTVRVKRGNDHYESGWIVLDDDGEDLLVVNSGMKDQKRVPKATLAEWQEAIRFGIPRVGDKVVVRRGNLDSGIFEKEWTVESMDSDGVYILSSPYKLVKKEIPVAVLTRWQKEFEKVTK